MCETLILNDPPMVLHDFPHSRRPRIHRKSLRNHTCESHAEKSKIFGYMVRQTLHFFEKCAKKGVPKSSFLRTGPAGGVQMNVGSVCKTCKSRFSVRSQSSPPERVFMGYPPRCKNTEISENNMQKHFGVSQFQLEILQNTLQSHTP